VADLTLRALLYGDDKTLSAALKRAGQEGETTGSKLATIGKAATIAGIAAVGLALKTGFGEVSDYQTGLAQLNAGLKSTGGVSGTTAKGMEDLASNIQAYSGQTDDSIVATEKLLLTFTNIRNVGPDKIFDETTKAAADMAARMGGDASEKAIVLGKALNDPIKGITALTRVGVSFTQGQKDQIAAMVKSGDTIGAQKIILGELNKEFGGSAKAYGETMPGQIARTKRAYEDVTQSLATALLPALAEVADITLKVTAYFRDHSGQAKILAGVVGGVLVVAVIAYTVNMIAAAAATIAATWPILAIIAAVALLAAGIFLLVTHFSQVTDFLGGTWGTAISAAIAVIFPFLGIPLLIIGHWKQIAGFFTGMWSGIESAARGFFNAWSDIWNSIYAVVDWVWSKLIKPVVDKISGAIGAVKGAVGAVAGAAGKAGGFIGSLNPFADGGVVPGRVGAAVPILAHGGEVVLNPNQQAGVAALIGRGGVGSSSGGVTVVNNYTIQAPLGDPRSIMAALEKVAGQAKAQGYQTRVLATV